MGDLVNNKTNPNNNNLHDAWAAIRDLSSAFLVVIMLIMIFSQAISFGPFDAYTLRKLLPKMVVAIILMQFSWILLGWVVDMVNYIGQGISALMYAPFPGGSSNLQGKNALFWLLGNAGIGTTAMFLTFGWPTLLIAGIGLAMATLPAIMAAAFVAGIAFLVGLAALIFRKTLIMLCILFAPLALLVWILPGASTQKYFKTWSDNFSKALMMYPLIMVLIAGGRIFAWVSGQQHSELISFLMVMVGYFGPLFLLPKTYKWGGSIMASAGNAIATSGLVKGINEKGGAGLRGIGERWQGKRADKYTPQDSFLKRGYRRVQSGHAIPFSKRSQRLAIATGDKWRAEQEEQATALLKRKGDTARRRGYETALRNEKGQPKKYRRNTAGELLKSDGTVTADESEAQQVRAASYEEADKKKLTGVPAMKQMWLDQTEDGRDEHEREMAVRLLRSTSSWPEFQGSFTKSGRRAFETKAWDGAITRGTDDYASVLRSRVDATPHVKDAAEKEAVEIGHFKRGDDSLEAREYKSGRRILYSINKQMSNEDINTQSDGFWEEAARQADQRDENGNLTATAKEIRVGLQNRFASIQKAGPTARQQALSHLMSGGPLQKNVDHILGEGNGVGTYLTGRGYDPTDTSVVPPTIPPPRETPPPGASPEGPPPTTPPSTPPAPPAAPAAAPATPAEGISPRGGTQGFSGETTIPHGTAESTRPAGMSLTRETIPANPQQWIEQRGGLQNISFEDLYMLFNTQRGTLQKTIRGELERTGAIRPVVPLGGAGGLPGSGSASVRIVHDEPSSPTPGTVISPPPEVAPLAPEFEPGGKYQPPAVPPIDSSEFEPGGKYQPPDIPPPPNNLSAP